VRLIAVIAGVLAIATIAWGCGGDEEGTASAPAGKAEFIEKADALCTRGGKETEAEIAAYAKDENVDESKEPTPAQSEEVIAEIVVPALRKQVDEIRALGVPTEDEAQVNGFLDDIDAALDKAEDDPKNAVRSLGEEMAKADQQIQGYFRVCGQEK
jgi:hypothetical protein